MVSVYKKNVFEFDEKEAHHVGLSILNGGASSENVMQIINVNFSISW